MGVDISFMGWDTVKTEGGWIYQINKNTGERRALADYSAEFAPAGRDKLDTLWLGDGAIID